MMVPHIPVREFETFPDGRRVNPWWSTDHTLGYLKSRGYGGQVLCSLFAGDIDTVAKAMVTAELNDKYFSKRYAPSDWGHPDNPEGEALALFGKND